MSDLIGFIGRPSPSRSAATGLQANEFRRSTAVNDDRTPDTGISEDRKEQEPRLWRDDGWTARIIKNEEDDGWAVEMTLDGQAEPALVGPWTMGRDKKNPKPLDSPAFITLVKTANEVLRRHEQQLHATLHKSVKIDAAAGRLTIKLDIVPDEDEPYAVLSAYDEFGEQLAQVHVAPTYKLSVQRASEWASGGFGKHG
jgi:hypothetical protein